MSNHGKPIFEFESIEDRMYVLRYVFRYRSSNVFHQYRGRRYYEYYTGKAVTKHINKAKIFTLEKAKNTKQFAHSATGCEIKRVTQKMLFKAALQGI